MIQLPFFPVLIIPCSVLTFHPLLPLVDPFGCLHGLVAPHECSYQIPHTAGPTGEN